MNRILGVAVVIILLFSGYALADGNNRHHSLDQSRGAFYPGHGRFPVPTRQGWDVSQWAAERSSNCHRYALFVEGGRGSARITSLPGKNYIQLTNGQKNGYVCFNEPSTLELGKLADSNVAVVLDIENIGIYYFDRGDRGSKQVNNWLRTYWDL